MRKNLKNRTDIELLSEIARVEDALKRTRSDALKEQYGSYLGKLKNDAKKRGFER